MEISHNFQPKRRKPVLSTRRKMRVLAALDPDSKENSFDLGKEVMTFLQNEQFHVECLKCLIKCLTQSTLKEAVESSDDILRLLDEILSIHSNSCSNLICGKKELSSVLKDLAASLDTYVSYSVFIKLEMNHFQMLSETHHIDLDLLQEPMTHISRWKTFAENLYNVEPKEEYSYFLKAVEATSRDIENALSLRKNALRTLQIQKLLFKRKPKIFSPCRIVLKEGVLYKVNSKGRALKERVFFLFNDILLCCRILSKTGDWHEKESLLFQALFPLDRCLVSLVMGSKAQGSLFKVTCGATSYLLISKFPGEAQNWFDALQAAISTNQKPIVNIKPKLNRQKKISWKSTQRIAPFSKKSVRSDDKKEPKDVAENESQFPQKKSLNKNILTLLDCVKV